MMLRIVYFISVLLLIAYRHLQCSVFNFKTLQPTFIII